MGIVCSFFLLPSSFFPLPSSFFRLPSSFFRLPSDFFLPFKHRSSKRSRRHNGRSKSKVG
ncbi:MAG: hypothetical protein EAZ39_01065 [Oscillatoriales cyanobacterium]|nr:MAG: hypothetical protein EAZ88_19265 [Oscillatoriales cyanobacterium]TAF95124.1 MAG: hypothetical protein EAZ45_26235 [Oscillatoriales cyanobacterium]TAG23302.1 MAG: hypothetical protein EAZ39_01065 [Oscillatoriales cyanobacterium]TAG38421.1 MAG: hypothetical protein EAZ33_20235 [Oscillatoriales cyanobacterium]